MGRLPLAALLVSAIAAASSILHSLLFPPSQVNPPRVVPVALLTLENAICSAVIWRASGAAPEGRAEDLRSFSLSILSLALALFGMCFLASGEGPPEVVALLLLATTLSTLASFRLGRRAISPISAEIPPGLRSGPLTVELGWMIGLFLSLLLLLWREGVRIDPLAVPALSPALILLSYSPVAYVAVRGKGREALRGVWLIAVGGISWLFLGIHLSSGIREAGWMAVTSAFAWLIEVKSVLREMAPPPQALERAERPSITLLELSDASAIRGALERLEVAPDPFILVTRPGSKILLHLIGTEGLHAVYLRAVFLPHPRALSEREMECSLEISQIMSSIERLSSKIGSPPRVVFEATYDIALLLGDEEAYRLLRRISDKVLGMGGEVILISLPEVGSEVRRLLRLLATRVLRA